MPNERAGDPGSAGNAAADVDGAAGSGTVDGRHLLLIGAGLALEWPWHAASPRAATG